MFNRLFCLVFFCFIGAQLMAQPEFALARQYYADEEYEKAIDYLDKAEQRGPNQNIYALKLDCYLALRDYKAAEKYIDRSIKQARYRNFDFYSDLCYVYNKQEKYNQADKLVAEVLEQTATNPSMAYGLANSFQKRGYPKIALEIYLAAEQGGRSSNYLYQKSLLYGELGEVKNMYETYIEMVEVQPTYLATVKQLLGQSLAENDENENTEYLKQRLIERIQAGGPETLNELLVFIFIKQKNFNGAFVQLKALDKRNGAYNQGPLFNLGKVALNNDEFLTARRVFDYLIKSGDNGPYYEEASIYSLRTERLRLLSLEGTTLEQWQALQTDYYATARELKGTPSAGDLAIDLADVSAFQLEETDTAIALLKRVLQTGYVSLEDHARAKIKLGDILLYRGNRWEAIIYYGQAEKAFESSPIGQEAKFKRAKAAYYVGDFEWAQGIFGVLKASTSKLIANDAMFYSMLITDNMALDTNTEAISMYARADLMHYQKKLDSAIQILEAMEIAFVDHPIEDEVLFLKAKILLERNQYEAAVEPLLAIIEDHPKDILADDAQYQLALILETKLNRPEEAMDLYQQLFTLHPDSFFASSARERFRALRGDLVN